MGLRPKHLEFCRYRTMNEKKPGMVYSIRTESFRKVKARSVHLRSAFSDTVRGGTLAERIE